jgi:hypothetical protein
VRRVRAHAAIVTRGTTGAHKSAVKSQATTPDPAKGRMLHIRLDPELHRKLRLVVAAQDTTLQGWITRTLEDAAEKAWPQFTRESSR